MLERNVEKKVKDYARSKGWLAYKWVAPGHAGVPDALLVSPTGKVMFIEFKQLGKLPTPLQLRVHNRLIAMHQTVYVVDSIEQGKRIIDETS